DRLATAWLDLFVGDSWTLNVGLRARASVRQPIVPGPTLPEPTGQLFDRGFRLRRLRSTIGPDD
ncbi:MAG: hypothetical protein AAFU77_13305, partial [Myxococcota bacterium]